ncbi:MAG: hypothetical protein AAGA25_11260 [Planctomycetota bacterium]
MSDSAEPHPEPVLAPADSGPTLQDYLANREEACPSCGYNLRGLMGNTCPECGVALTLRVGLMEPRLMGLIAGLGSASVAFGIGAFFMIGTLLLDDIGRFFRDEPIAAWTLLAMLLGGTLGLLILIIRRRRLYAMGRNKQTWLAICSIIIVVALVTFVLSQFG